MTTAYALNIPDSLLTDGAVPNTAAAAWLHDLPRNPEHWRIEALAASGDFCETLAVTLEQIATALPVHSVEQYQIQDAIGHLLYVQRHYKLVKRGGPLRAVSRRTRRQD